MAAHFKFELKDSIIRGMTRQQYKFASHMVRWVARRIDGMMDWEKVNEHLTRTLIYGHSRIEFGDLLKD